MVKVDGQRWGRARLRFHRLAMMMYLQKCQQSGKKSCNVFTNLIGKVTEYTLTLDRYHCNELHPTTDIL